MGAYKSIFCGAWSPDCRPIASERNGRSSDRKNPITGGWLKRAVGPCDKVSHVADATGVNAVTVVAVNAESASSAGTYVRPVTQADGPSIHALLAATLPDVLADYQRWLERWHWQYWQNPFRGSRSAGWVLAERRSGHIANENIASESIGNGERVLGHLGAVYLPLRIGDQQLTGVIGADYAVSDGAAGQGSGGTALELAQRLFAESGTHVVMITTANEKTGAVFGRFGGKAVPWTREFWQASSTLAQQIRSRRSGNPISRRFFSGRVGSLLLHTLAAAYRLVGHVPAVPISSGCRLEIVEPESTNALATFWQQSVLASLKPSDTAAWPIWQTQLTLERSQTWLDWRYTQHPERHRMRMLIVRDADDAIRGSAIVFRDKCKDRHVCYVEDMMVWPHRVGTLRTLLCAALRYAKECGAEQVVTTPGNSAVRTIFSELGFQQRICQSPSTVIYMSSSLRQASVSVPPGFSPSEHFDFWHGLVF